jgi:hypothetical protein
LQAISNQIHFNPRQKKGPKNIPHTLYIICCGGNDLQVMSLTTTPETGHQNGLVLSWCYDQFTFYFAAMGPVAPFWLRKIPSKVQSLNAKEIAKLQI